MKPLSVLAAASLVLTATVAGAIPAHADGEPYPVSVGAFFLDDQDQALDQPAPSDTSITLSVDGQVIASQTGTDRSDGGMLTPGDEYVVEAVAPDGYELVSCLTFILNVQAYPIGWDVGTHTAQDLDPDDPFFDRYHYVCFASVNGQDSGEEPVEAPDTQSIEPACEQTTTGRFPDIDGVTHERAIECIGWWGVTAGNPDGTYAPAGTVTRDQMASFVARVIELTGGTLPATPPNAFTDDDGNTHELRINQLAELGVIGGVGDGQYNPAGIVNRAQMATFLARAWEARTGTPLPAGADYFADISGNTHETNINAVAAAGFTGGTGAGYNPDGPVTRAQMATFLSRFVAKLVADGHADYPPEDPRPLPDAE